MREEFISRPLDQKDLDLNPFRQFERWFKDTERAGYHMPNAMTIATVSADGQPSMRMVLLKFYDERGFVFYTNYGSKKAHDIELNPKVALHFPWHDIYRQVRITGKAEKIPATESLKYFLTRPKDSQIGAWVSNQSQVISSRQLLMSEFEKLKKKFFNKEVPLPSFWGGYRIVPDSFEFWQGQESRLHDRFLYTRQEGGWTIERLAP